MTEKCVCVLLLQVVAEFPSMQKISNTKQAVNVGILDSVMELGHNMAAFRKCSAEGEYQRYKDIRTNAMVAGLG
jgi:hypothetical protein